MIMNMKAVHCGDDSSSASIGQGEYAPCTMSHMRFDAIGGGMWYDAHHACNAIRE